METAPRPRNVHPLVACVLVALLALASSVEGYAQEKVTQTDGEVEPASEGGDGSKSSSDDGEISDDAKESGDGETSDDGEEEGGPDAASEQSITDTLVSEYGIAEEKLTAEEDVGALVEAATGRISELDERVDELDTALVKRNTIGEMLSRQLSAELPESATRRLAVEALRNRVDRAALEAEKATLESTIEDVRQQKVLLEARIDEIAEEKTRLAQIRQEELRRQEQAEEAEEEAMERLRKAREREKRERDATLRNLLSRERKIAEESLEVTREHNDRLSSIARETEADVEAFNEREGNLLEKIDEFPVDPTAKQRTGQVDPVFDELAEGRAATYVRLDSTLDELDELDGRIGELRDELEAARAELAEERAVVSEHGESEIWKRRVAVAQARVDLHAKKLENAEQNAEAYQERVDEYESELAFYEGTLQQLVDQISNSRRRAFFSIGSDGNWEAAFAGLRHGARAIWEGTFDRVDDLRNLDLVSWNLWAWMWGFFWRFLALLVVVRFVLPAVPAIVRKLTEWMFRRTFFRRRPTFTIKVAELLRALMRPAVFLIGVEYLAAYVAGTFPEFEALVWIVDAAFIYWLTIEAVQVLVLPRWYRRQEGRASAEEFGHLDEGEASAVADIIGMEVNRAKKLVRSARVVLVFWLLSAYVPDFVQLVTGTTVIWWLVDRVAVWGFVGIVYWVISQWKDDIAAMFERLAKERLPRAVTFVNNQKDRPWGVLIIAAASLYVIVKELGIVGRRYVLNTEWFKRASTFAFRKKIEMQARERDENGGVQEAAPGELPDDYLAHFRPEPLEADDERFIERDAQSEVMRYYGTWREERRQGSIALVGEQGIGKTTLLRRIESRLDEGSNIDVVSVSIDDRLKRKVEVVEFMADVFGLETTPESKEELIDVVSDLEPRAILLDDCHNVLMRRIGGFDSLEVLLDVVNLTDETHFYVLTFNIFAWQYADRVSSREHYFGRILELGAWSDESIQSLIEQRTAQTEYSTSFTDLVVAHDDTDGQEYFFEVVKTANGYFRYLHEFCGGNPRIALVYWLRSLRHGGDSTLQVSLFRRPSTDELTASSDDHWFVLTAIAQHGELDAREISQIVNMPDGFCSLALNYFAEQDIVTIDRETRRAHLDPLYFRQVLKHLANANFLYR